MTKFKGSDTPRAPFGSVIESLPLNVSFCKVVEDIAGSPEEPLEGNATVAAVIVRSPTPNAFDIRMRICSEPRDMCRVCRMVEFTKSVPLVFYRDINYHIDDAVHRLTNGGGGRLVYSVN